MFQQPLLAPLSHMLHQKMGQCLCNNWTAPFCSSGTHNHIFGKWTVDWVTPEWSPLAPLAHMATYKGRTTFTQQPCLKTLPWLQHAYQVHLKRRPPLTPLAHVAMSSGAIVPFSHIFRRYCCMPGRWPFMLEGNDQTRD